MTTETMIPTLDNAALQKKVNEAAMKGAEKAIEEYYTGYDSPFKKAISEHLKGQQIGGIIELPDIIALINKKLTDELMGIANRCVSASFVPLLTRMMTRVEKEIDFSTVLKFLVEETHEPDYYDFEIEMVKDATYGWYNVRIEAKDNTYNFTLHRDHQSEKEGKERYHLLSLPNRCYDTKQMKLKVGDASLELPFTPNALQDKFVAYLASLVISGSLITIDRTEFDEEWFHQCHCH